MLKSPEGEASPDKELGFSPFATTIWGTLTDEVFQLVKHNSEFMKLTIDTKCLRFIPWGEGKERENADVVCGVLNIVCRVQGKGVEIIREDTEDGVYAVFTSRNPGLDRLKDAKMEVVKNTNAILKIFGRPHI